MIPERYTEGEGFLYALDARVKVVLTLLLMVGILLTPERAAPAYPLLWALLAGLATASHISVRRLARWGGAALPFALAALTLPFTLRGDPVGTIAGLTVYDTGLIRCMSILLKSWLSVQAALLLSLTTPFTDLLWAFERLRMPETLIAISAVMVRYLFTLTDEVQRLIRARAARSASLSGRKAGGSLLWRAQSAGGMVGSLFLRSYERSERVYAAMVARGYTGHLRTLKPTALRRADVMRGAIPAIILISIEVFALLAWTH